MTAAHVATTSPELMKLYGEARRIIRYWPAVRSGGLAPFKDPVAGAAAVAKLRAVNARIHRQRDLEAAQAQDKGRAIADQYRSGQQPL